MIGAAVRRQTARYKNQFADALPFRHVVIDSFFEPDHAERLLADFPVFDPENAKNEFGEVGRKATVADIRKISPFYADVYRYVGSRDFLDFVSELTSIPELLHDEFMFGGGTHENLEGQDLDPHVDFNYLEDRKLHRRLNLLLYLNKEWEQSWGGCLELHSNPRRPRENKIKVIEPMFNRCVIFETTERSWHGFERIELPQGKKHLSRKMLSVYLYTRDRPDDELAPPHSTFFVQRPLAKHLVAGHVLTVEDVEQLEDQLWRRDTWIELYQKKELDQSRKIQERERWAERQAQELAESTSTIRAQQAELEQAVAWAKDLDRQLDEARRILDRRQAELDEKAQWARSIDSERERLQARVLELQADLEEKVKWARSLESDVERAREALNTLHGEFDERTRWALQLSAEREQLSAERERLMKRVQELEAELHRVMNSVWTRAGALLGIVRDKPRPLTS